MAKQRPNRKVDPSTVTPTVPPVHQPLTPAEIQALGQAALDAQAAKYTATQADVEDILQRAAVQFAKEKYEAETILGETRARDARNVLTEIARRKIEAVNLFEPLPNQAPIFQSDNGELLIRGSNRSGKTLTAAVIVAKALTGRDPFGHFPGKDGRCFLVGKDLHHVAQVMWRKLSRAGAFKMIRDKQTGEWRAFRPQDPEDRCRNFASRPAPPLLPPRFIKKIAWEDKAEGIPKFVTLTNGWEISFFSSLGLPPNGNDIDLAWFDEEIEHQAWYPEVSARLLDRAGRLIWSVTPQVGTAQVYELHERAEKQAMELPPQERTCVEHVILLADNPHITETQKRQFEAKLSEEEATVRVGGEFAFISYKVYPEYNRVAHWVEDFAVPSEWTNFAVVDPGRQICAVLFGAVPPPELGVYCYLFDELYIPHCDAATFGREMRRKCSGRDWHAFIVDIQGGRVHDTGSGRTIVDQYVDALKANGVRCKTTGHNFTWSNPDVMAGVEATRGWFRRRDDDTCRLRMLAGRLPNMDWELRHYRYKKDPTHNMPTDVPENRGRVHLCACLRYLASFNPRYYKPEVKGRHVSPAVLAMRARDARRFPNRDHVRLGPGLGPAEYF